MFQDPKYAIFAVNRATGRPVPQHIPLMLFSGRDVLATLAIGKYVEANKQAHVSPEQIASAEERLRAFVDFANDSPAEMKMPGTRAAPLEQPVFPVNIDAHYTYWLSGGNVVQFVKPGEDDTLLPGTTTEEVLGMLIDRVTKQNELYPSDVNKHTLAYLTAALGTQVTRMVEMARELPPGVVEKFGIHMHPNTTSVSGNLAGYGYDAARCVLALEFRGGRIYHYKDVPQHVYDGLIEAESKGSYAAQVITGKFEGARMEETAAAA